MAKPVAANELTTAKAWLQAGVPQIVSGLPSYLPPDKRQAMADRIRRVVLTISGAPNMRNVAPESFCKAAIRVAQMGLDPDPVMGQAYLVPFKDQLQVIVGYRGYLELAWRTGKVLGVRCEPVYEGESFVYRNGREFILEHEPDLDRDHEAEDPRAVYCVVDLAGGGIAARVLGRAEVESYRNRSSGYRNAVKYSRTDNPWFTDKAAMYRKTAIRRVAVMIPQSTEYFAPAMERDDDADPRESTLVAKADQQELPEPPPRKGLTLDKFLPDDQKYVLERLKNEKGFNRAQAQEYLFAFDSAEGFLASLEPEGEAGPGEDQNG